MAVAKPSLSEALPAPIAEVRAVGSQATIDTEQRRSYLIPSYGILPRHNLHKYLWFYEHDCLAKAIVDADVSLIVSPFVYMSPREEVNEWLREWHRRVGFDQTFREMVFHTSLYGFACPETVGNAGSLMESSRVLRHKPNDPRFMIIQKDLYGRLTYFRQRPAYAWPLVINNPKTSPYLDIVVEPEAIAYVASMAADNSCYGYSQLESLMTSLRWRRRLMNAAVISAEKFANAVDWLMYETDGEAGETQADIDEQVCKLEKGTDGIIKKKTRFLISGCKRGAYRWVRMGADSLPDLTKLIDRLTKDVVISAGFHPAVFAEGDSGKDGETSRYTVETIKARQQWIMHYIHQNLYSLLPYIEADCPANSPEEIVVGLEAPDQTTLIDRMNAETTLINNIILKVRSGMIEPNRGAHEAGESEWYDPSKLEQGANIQDQVNKSDPNEDQQIRKAIQSRAEGRSPSNNATGGNKQ